MSEQERNKLNRSKQKQIKANRSKLKQIRHKLKREVNQIRPEASRGKPKREANRSKQKQANANKRIEDAHGTGPATKGICS